MNVQLELKPYVYKDAFKWIVRAITPSLYNRMAVGGTPTAAKAALTRYLPGGVDYEFEIVGF